jgi:hypothetical protein
VQRPTDCDDGNPGIRPGIADRPGDGIDQDCFDGDAPFPLLGRTIVGFSSTYPSGYTRFTTLTVRPARAGDRIRLTCKGRGCPLARKTVRVRKDAKRLSLLRHIGRARLRKGAVLRLRVTRPETVGRVHTWRIRAPKPPKLVRRCVRPGEKKPTACPAG